MLVICHRGYHETTPENTLESFASAASLGVQGIETDVRLSADGQLVLYHNRVAPDGSDLLSLTRAELSARAGYPVPTLSEALEHFPDLRWFLEIKTPRAVPETIRVLKSFLPSRRCVVISFWHDVVKNITLELGVEGGLLVSHSPLQLDTGFFDRMGNPWIRYVIWNYEFLDERYVAIAREHDCLMLVYDVESRAEHDNCARLGIHGVITDHPQYLLGRAGEARLERESGAPMPSIAPPTA